MEPSQKRKPPAAIWNAADGRVKNISTSLMRPLNTSCQEHQHFHQRNQQSYSHPSNNGGIVKSSSPIINSVTTTPARPRFLTLNSLPRMPPPPDITQRRDPAMSPFMRLPTEIRLQIYSLLVLPRRSTDLLPSYQKITASTQDYFDYDRKIPGTNKTLAEDMNNPTLRIRTIEPMTYAQRFGQQGRQRQHVRSSYSVRADRFGARCMQTTYHCVNNPRLEDNLAILRTNKQIHAEAAELLYSTYTFDFDMHVEAIIPFLKDLTPFTRSCIKSIRIVKRALPYLREFDKCEWSNALRSLTNGDNSIRLRRLELGVVAGRPGQNGWDRISTYSPSDFSLLKSQ